MNLEVALCAKHFVPGSLLHRSQIAKLPQAVAEPLGRHGLRARSSSLCFVSSAPSFPDPPFMQPTVMDRKTRHPSQWRMVDPKPRLDVALSDLTRECCDAAGEHDLGGRPVHP